MQQVDLPVPTSADLDEVGGRPERRDRTASCARGSPFARTIPRVSLKQRFQASSIPPSRAAASKPCRWHRCKASRAGSCRTASAARLRLWSAQSPIRPSCPRRTSKSSNAGQSALHRQTSADCYLTRKLADKTLRSRPRRLRCFNTPSNSIIDKRYETKHPLNPLKLLAHLLYRQSARTITKANVCQSVRKNSRPVLAAAARQLSGSPPLR